MRTELEFAYIGAGRDTFAADRHDSAALRSELYQIVGELLFPASLCSVLVGLLALVVPSPIGRNEDGIAKTIL